MNIFSKVFGTYSEREVKRVMPIVEKINSLEEEISKLSDTELQAKTNEFKSRLEKGETLDDISKKFGIIKDLILSINNLHDDAYFGMQLILPKKEW